MYPPVDEASCLNSRQHPVEALTPVHDVLIILKAERFVCVYECSRYVFEVRMYG